MKKVAYLLAMIFTLALMSTSCEKDDPIVPEDKTLITSTEFSGDWMFQSITLDSEFGDLEGTYDDCDSDANDVWDYITLHIKNVTATTLNLYSDCMDAGDPPDTNPDYSYTIELVNGETIINCDGSRKFKVVDYTEPYLELELTHSSSSSLPVGAVYMLKHEN